MVWFEDFFVVGVVIDCKLLGRNEDGYVIWERAKTGGLYTSGISFLPTTALG